MRITDQYIWNVIFLAFFAILVFMGIIILDGEAYRTYESLTVTDYVLMTLATWRFTRLFVYDKITAFFREQFSDPVEVRGEMVLQKPSGGPRRTLAELLACPWCFGVWSGATVAFFYLLTPYATFPVIFLAISAVATFFQILSNMIGWKAEQLKAEVEEG